MRKDWYPGKLVSTIASKTLLFNKISTGSLLTPPCYGNAMSVADRDADENRLLLDLYLSISSLFSGETPSITQLVSGFLFRRCPQERGEESVSQQHYPCTRLNQEPPPLSREAPQRGTTCNAWASSLRPACSSPSWGRLNVYPTPETVRRNVGRPGSGSIFRRKCRM